MTRPPIRRHTPPRPGAPALETVRHIALDRTRQFLAALEGEEWEPTPEGAPPDAVQLARQAGRAAEHLVLTFLEMQAGGWRPRPESES
jgi:hypothetical protein